MPTPTNDARDDADDNDRTVSQSEQVEDRDHIEGERDIPSVNRRSNSSNSEGPGAAQKAIVAVCGLLALLFAGAYYYPKLKGGAPQNAASSAIAPEKTGTLAATPQDTQLPTAVKAEVDRKAAALAQAEAARAARNRPPPIVPALGDNQVGGLPPPNVQRVLTPEEKAEARKRQEALDQLERRKRSPLIAYDATRGGSAGAEKTETGRRGPLSIEEATAIAQKIADGQAGGSSGGLGGLAGTPRTPPKPSANGSDDLGGKITPTTVSRVSAATLPNRDLLLTQGTFIDCTLETALDSTVPGFTRCVTTRNIYSNSGRVVIFERGTKIIGQYQGGIKQGQSRIFIMWTRAETPHGVVINLDSPSTDPLGAAGAPGDVDTKFWARFGSALLLSIIQDAFDIAKQEVSDSDSVILQAGNTEDTSKSAAEIALENSINIPPVLYKNQGEKINVILARDLDFSDVYSLRLSSN